MKQKKRTYKVKKVNIIKLDAFYKKVNKNKNSTGNKRI